MGRNGTQQKVTGINLFLIIAFSLSIQVLIHSAKGMNIFNVELRNLGSTSDDWGKYHVLEHEESLSEAAAPSPSLKSDMVRCQQIDHDLETLKAQVTSLKKTGWSAYLAFYPASFEVPGAAVMSEISELLQKKRQEILGVVQIKKDSKSGLKGSLGRMGQSLKLRSHTVHSPVLVQDDLLNQLQNTLEELNLLRERDPDMSRFVFEREAVIYRTVGYLYKYNLVPPTTLSPWLQSKVVSKVLPIHLEMAMHSSSHQVRQMNPGSLRDYIRTSSKISHLKDFILSPIAARFLSPHISP